MRHELFIYYRAPASRSAALLDAVRHMQQTLAAAAPGLEARVLQRCEAGASAEVTWMEAYRLPAEADPEALTATIEAAACALAPWLAGPRHVEHFLPCA